jgi:hypothetical protein
VAKPISLFHPSAQTPLQVHFADAEVAKVAGTTTATVHEIAVPGIVEARTAKYRRGESGAGAIVQ